MHIPEVFVAALAHHHADRIVRVIVIHSSAFLVINTCLRRRAIVVNHHHLTVQVMGRIMIANSHALILLERVYLELAVADEETVRRRPIAVELRVLGESKVARPVLHERLAERKG